MSKVAGSKRASEYRRRPQLMSYRMARHLSAGAVVRVVVAQVGLPPKTLEGGSPALEAIGAFDAADVRALERSCEGSGSRVESNAGEVGVGICTRCNAESERSS